MRKVYLLEIIFVIWLIILVLLLVPFAVKAEDGEPPMIAFTFDDGPNAVQTSRLLDGLQELPLLDSLPAPEPEERPVLDAVLALPPMDRAVIHLFYYEGYSTGEIARITGQLPGTVRSRLSRSREKLRHMLSEEGFSDGRKE